MNGKNAVQQGTVQSDAPVQNQQQNVSPNLAQVPGAAEAVQELTINTIMTNPQVFGYLMQLSQIMASGGCTIPAHLQGNQGDCMAIILQSSQWKMNPWAVAQKTHIVNKTLGYEAQLVNAVITHCGAIDGNFDYEWFGPWENVIGKFKTKQSSKGNTYQVPDWTSEDEKGCGIKVSAVLRKSGERKTLELFLCQATVRNSTLWASDPKQQLAYLGVKRWGRLYAPGAIMGVYTPDELEEAEVEKQRPIKNITPKGESQADKLKSMIGGEDGKPEANQEPEKPKAKSKSIKKTEVPVDPFAVNAEAPKNKETKKEENQEKINITDAQRRMIFAILKDVNINKDYFKVHLFRKFGYESTSDIVKDKFEEVIKWVKAKCPME